MIKKAVFCLLLMISLFLVFHFKQKESALLNDDINYTDKIVLRYAEVNSETDPIMLAIRYFAEVLKEKSEERIIVDIYSSGELGDHKEVLQFLQMGAIDMTRTQPLYLEDFGIEQINLYSLPYLFRDVDHAWKVLEGEVGKQLLHEIQLSGSRLVGMGYYATSPRNFFFKNKHVTRLSEMKGLKLRVPQGKMYADIVEAFGAIPVAIGFGELYSALQTGEVDGAENPLKGYHSGKYYEVAKYYTNVQHQADPSIILISEITWNKLTTKDQLLIQEATEASIDYFKKISKEQEEKARSELEAAGVEFREVENPQEWQDSVQPLYKKYGVGYEDLIERIQNIK